MALISNLIYQKHLNFEEGIIAPALAGNRKGEGLGHRLSEDPKFGVCSF